MKGKGRTLARRKSQRPTALVLTGGGARGAYEAGVMQFLFGPFLKRKGRRRLFDIFAGTSAGALNACAMAATADNPPQGINGLESYWRSLVMNRFLKFDGRELVRLPSVFLGRGVGSALRRLQGRPPSPKTAPHPPISGIFDTTSLHEDMARVIPWARLQDNLAKGTVTGIAVCATEVCTSQSVVFYQTGKNGSYRASKDASKEERPVRMSVEHAMASAAIPFLFPAIQVEGVCYVDGALRLNIPLSPAIRMGAEKILVIGLSMEPEIKYRTARMGCRRTPYPGAMFLLGRTVTALMDGFLDHELDRIEMFNRFVLEAEEAFGGSCLERLNQVSLRYRNTGYRRIRVLQIRPSRNLNDLAIEALQEAPHELNMPGPAGRLANRVMKSSAFLESDLSSFLLFMPTFIDKLIRLGYRDAERKEDDLNGFFLDNR